MAYQEAHCSIGMFRKIQGGGEGRGAAKKKFGRAERKHREQEWGSGKSFGRKKESPTACRWMPTVEEKVKLEKKHFFQKTIPGT